MAVILNLIIAHLLADFVFQSNRIIEEKEKGVYGHMNHAIILLFWTTVFLLPYWGSLIGWLVIAIVASSHFLLDIGKTALKKNNAVIFFIDQALHLIIIIFAGTLLKNLEPIRLPEDFLELYYNPNISLFIVLALLVSFVTDIAIYQIKHTKNKKLQYKRNHHSMALRFLVFLILYLVFLGFTSFQL